MLLLLFVSITVSYIRILKLNEVITYGYIGIYYSMQWIYQNTAELPVKM